MTNFFFMLRVSPKNMTRRVTIRKWQKIPNIAPRKFTVRKAKKEERSCKWIKILDNISFSEKKKKDIMEKRREKGEKDEKREEQKQIQ